jgi:hypothetical protein
MALSGIAIVDVIVSCFERDYIHQLGGHQDARSEEISSRFEERSFSRGEIAIE